MEKTESLVASDPAGWDVFKTFKKNMSQVLKLEKSFRPRPSASARARARCPQPISDGGGSAALQKEIAILGDAVSKLHL